VSASPIIPLWTPPWPTNDSATFIRISAAHLKGDQWTCAEQVAMKARPQISPVRDSSIRREFAPEASFALGTIHAALFAMLSRNMGRDDALEAAYADTNGDVTEPFRAAVEAGVDGYLQCLDELRASGALPPDTVVREFIGIDTEPQLLEWYGWGLLHISRDSQLREYHVLGQTRVDERTRSSASIGVYARIGAAPIAIQDGTPWWEPRAASPAQPREGSQVVVREIGVLDSSTALRFAGSIEQADAWFDAHVPGALSVLAGGNYEPGTGCVSCKARPECQGIARMPGVLGVMGASSWPRSFSPGDLHQANVCTKRVYLSRTLGLPHLEGTTSPAMLRGIHVHSWLELAHGQREPCSVDTLLPDQLDPIAEQLGWDLATYRGLRPFLLAHAGICPLTDITAETAIPEVTMTAWDTDVDVVVSTRADLVFSRDDATVVRETKTVLQDVSEHTDRDLLHRYPQVALTICLLADGYYPLAAHPPLVHRPRSASTVEIEFLAESGAHLRRFDAQDAEIVLIARASIANAVDRLLYTEPTASLGYWCGSCPVSAWCDDYQAGNNAFDLEMATAQQAATLIIAESAPVEENEFPF